MQGAVKITEALLKKVLVCPQPCSWLVFTPEELPQAQAQYHTYYFLNSSVVRQPQHQATLPSMSDKGRAAAQRPLTIGSRLHNCLSRSHLGDKGVVQMALTLPHNISNVLQFYRPAGEPSSHLRDKGVVLLPKAVLDKLAPHCVPVHFWVRADVSVVVAHCARNLAHDGHTSSLQWGSSSRLGTGPFQSCLGPSGAASAAHTGQDHRSAHWRYPRLTLPMIDTPVACSGSSNLPLSSCDSGLDQQPQCSAALHSGTPPS